jgi:hypothetical protein
MRYDFTKLLASLVIIFIFVSSPIAIAEPSWTATPDIFTCFFSGTATIDGEDIELGDVVGVFVNSGDSPSTVNDLCIGTRMVQVKAGQYESITTYGGENGADEGETVYFKIWDESENRISFAVPQGDNTWQSFGSKTVNLEATSGISADVSGNRKDIFERKETIYGWAILGLQPSTQYDVYVVADSSSWLDGDSIPDGVVGSESNFTTDENGNMPTTILYPTPVPGNYDIFIDVNGNKIYNDNADYLDDTLDVGAQSLPVKLSLLTATASENVIVICWRTETEVNNLGFSIYRSEEKDGKYTKIAFIPGAGSSMMPIDYQFIDDNIKQDQPYFYYLEDVDVAGEKSQSEIIELIVPPFQPELPTSQPELIIPKRFQLLQNYPNPFNPGTWFPYQLAEDSPVTIRIFNQKGQIVRILDLGWQNRGNFVTKDKAVYWDGRNNFGQPVASGVYIYTLQAGKFKAARKMLIMK